MKIPGLYERWLPPGVSSVIGAVSTDDCGDCLMLTTPNPLNSAPYSPSLKCCTFSPYMANFMVGDVLRKKSVGAKIIRERLASGESALPIGIIASIPYQRMFVENGDVGFGRNSDLLCPFYAVNDGTCSVWSSRSSECLSYSCTAGRDINGVSLKGLLRDYFFEIEMVVAQHALLYKGYSLKESDEQLSLIKIPKENISITVNKGMTHYWAHHFQAEEACYIEMSHWADDLRFADLLSMGFDANGFFREIFSEFD